MKKINLFAIALLLIGVIYSCSTSEQQGNEEKGFGPQKSRDQVVTPEGFVIAETSEQFSRMLFDEAATRTTINSVQFISQNNPRGAVAYIEFVQDGVVSSIGFAMGEARVSRSADVVQFINRSSGKAANFLTFRCRGTGCCRSGGYDDGDTHVFTCKCDGNPNQNQGCTMTVSQNSMDHYISSGY